MPLLSGNTNCAYRAYNRARSIVAEIDADMGAISDIWNIKNPCTKSAAMRLGEK